MAYKSIILPVRIFDVVSVERSDGAGYFTHLTIDEKDFAELEKAGAIAEEDAHPEHLKDGRLMHEFMGVAKREVGVVEIVSEKELPAEN